MSVTKNIKFTIINIASYMNKKIAHTENEKGIIHFLNEHLKSTAEIMNDLAIDKDNKELFYITGLLHDLGKYQNGFQKYLLKNGPRTPHASWGAAFARKLKMNEISFAIDGHHKGLPDKIDWQISTNTILNGSKLSSENVYEEFLMDLGLKKENFFCKKLSVETIFERELFVRYLFSLLTDADWLDTESHFDFEKSIERKSLKLDCDYLLTQIDSELKSKDKTGNINKLRNQTRNFAIKKSEFEQGFFSLNLPTGLGKTLTSVYWALMHARTHQLKRIIIVLPYVNIIDQTAIEMKRIFGKEFVLEHHSSYNEEDEKHQKNENNKNREKLATENWDYPIIITTTVQFFESLFANKPSKCRKIHNIAESVVIFDEVQTLPKELITPTLTMLRNIQKLLKTTFLFCTATQPAFEKNDYLKDGIDSIIPLAENPKKLFKETQRVKFNFLIKSKYELAEIIQESKNHNKSILSVFNTKKKTINAFNLADSSQYWDKCFHLSTSMCPAHRKMMIKQISNELKDKKNKIFVASTQLIEAGVDLDFPVVYRELAPLDSLIQSAGRCNREGKLINLGEVIIFQLTDTTMPNPLYSSLSLHTLELLNQNFEKIYDPSFFKKYFLSAIKLYVDDDKKKINDERKKFNFKTISSIYKIIDSPTTALFIWNYNDETRQLYEQIKYKPGLSRDDFRKIQNYSVQVYDNFLNSTIGSWEEKLKGFRVWNGKYTDKYGITEDITLDNPVI